MIATAGLGLDQAPPIHLPLRLFLTAPWFAAAAGVVLLLQGEAIMASRWSPAAPAVTHLLTVGFLGQILCGALLQLLPVIAGAPVPAVRLVGPGIHVLLSLGGVLLAAGFLGVGASVLAAGAVSAALGFGLFLTGATAALARAQGSAATRFALRLGNLSLAVTVGLGLLLTATLLGWVGLPRFPDWMQAHLTWGLLGWAGLVIVGVAYQVIPLFYVTPAYPDRMNRLLVPALFLALVAATLLTLTGLPRSWADGVYWALALGFAVFGTATTWLQLRRGRRRIDVTLIHWWLAMGALVVAAGAWWLQAPAELLGVLLLVGVGIGLPSGMLLKIVPFLCWFHLQARQVAAGRFDLRVPHLHLLIPERLARWHPLLHGMALVLLAAGVLVPGVTPLGGIALTASALWLFALMAGAVRRYRQVSSALGR